MAYTFKEIFRLQKSKTSLSKLEKTYSQEPTQNYPYIHLKKIGLSSFKRSEICQNNKNSKANAVRCTSLPSFVLEGWYVGFLNGGFLRD